jgi:hypothetical protein
MGFCREGADVMSKPHMVRAAGMEPPFNKKAA